MKCKTFLEYAEDIEYEVNNWLEEVDPQGIEETKQTLTKSGQIFLTIFYIEKPRVDSDFPRKADEDKLLWLGHR